MAELDPARIDPDRPWLIQRPGESDREYRERLNYTCGGCGTYIVDLRILFAHMNECPRDPRAVLGTDEDDSGQVWKYD